MLLCVEITEGGSWIPPEELNVVGPIDAFGTVYYVLRTVAPS